MADLRLVEAISRLRQELYEANKAGAKEELRLDIESVEVEFAVEIVKRGEGGAEICFNVYVVNAKLKAGGDLDNKYAHRIKLNLKPTLHGQTVPITGVVVPKKD
jgi:hypothetical protein